MFPYINWDISPLRPGEWWDMAAGDWVTAQWVQQAYQDGQADARDEHKTAKGTG